MDEYVLVRFDGDWADEMNVPGFFTSTKKEYDEYVESIQKYFETHTKKTYYIGTNEKIEYTSAEEVISSFRVVPITLGEYKTLWALFVIRGGDEVRNVHFGFLGPNFARYDELDDDMN